MPYSEKKLKEQVYNLLILSSPDNLLCCTLSWPCNNLMDYAYCSSYNSTFLCTSCEKYQSKLIFNFDNFGITLGIV